MLLRHRTSRDRRIGLSSTRRGFTLIELLVALLLLDVGLLGLVGFATTLYRNGSDTHASARAWALASARVERMASVACGSPSTGTATRAGGVSEWFTETAAPNETRLLVDSVRIATSRSARVATIRTFARC